MYIYNKNTSTAAYSDEINFCAMYLHEHGITSADLDDILARISQSNSTEKNFELVRIKHGPQDTFFEELAKELIKLWPTGEKDGKYAWRDTVFNITKRLKNLWLIRGLESPSLDTCLAVARRYLSRFESSTKYMKILKYFILKQGKVIGPDGKITYTNESTFADMLEGKQEEDAVQNEWEELISNASAGEGELI